MGACPASCLSDVQIGRIGVGLQHHVAGSKGDAIIWVCGGVVQELVGGIVGGLGGRGLMLA